MGCVYQERHGWERPGWFNNIPSPPQDYDWYGAYETPESEDTRYKSALGADYSFDFPEHHEQVSQNQIKKLYVLENKICECLMIDLRKCTYI